MRPHHNIMKLQAEYRAKFYEQNGKNLTRGGLFYMDDFAQLITNTSNEVDLVYMALEAGFMAGYKYAKKEARKKAQAQKQKQERSKADAAGSDDQ